MLYSNDVAQIGYVSKAAADFLANHDLATIECGHYELNDIEWVNIVECSPLPREERCYESHRDYIDIQMVIEGAELIEVAPVDTCTVTQPYSEEGDCALYSNETAGERFLLTPGRFIAVYPDDAHMPTITAGVATSRKAIFKIHV